MRNGFGDVSSYTVNLGAAKVESCGFLDKTNSENVIGILKKLQKMGKTIVLVTHDQSYRNIGDRVINI